MPSSPSPPPAPNPVAISQAQGAANKETAVAQTGLNSTNQVSPYGNLSYSQIGKWDDGTPRFQATQTLSPGEQQLYDQSTANQQQLGQTAGQQIGRVQGILNSPFDPTTGNPFNISAALDKLSTAGTDFDIGGGINKFANFDPTQAINNQSTDISRKLLDPVWNARQSALESKLANQGIQQGSEAYTNALRDFSNERDTSYNTMQLQGRAQALAEAQAQGGALQQNVQNLMGGRQQLTGEAQQAFGDTVQGRQQTIQEALARRNQPLNEISALMSGSQVSQPNFISTPQSTIAPTNVLGAYDLQNQANQSAYQGKVSQNNAMLGGLFSIPSMALGGWASGGFKPPTGLSDRRAKTDITRIGTADNGLPIYRFRYHNNPEVRIGFMADEVEQLHPKAVSEHYGVKFVNYQMATE